MTEEKKPELEPVALRVSWFRDEDQNLDGLRVGVFTEAKQVSLGISSAIPHQGLMIIFPEDNSAILLQGDALSSFIQEVDWMLHNVVKSDPTEVELGGASSATNKVSLPN